MYACISESSDAWKSGPKSGIRYNEPPREPAAARATGQPRHLHLLGDVHVLSVHHDQVHRDAIEGTQRPQIRVELLVLRAQISGHDRRDGPLQLGLLVRPVQTHVLVRAHAPHAQKGRSYLDHNYLTP